MNGNPRLVFSDIAVCNLKRKPFRAGGLIFLVALLSFVLFGGSLIAFSLFNGTDGLSKRLGADILIVPQGYDQKVEGILLRGEPSAFYMDAEWLGRIADVEGVRAVSPQLLIASLNADCCSMPIQLIGFDRETDFVVEPWIRTALPGALSDGEIVVGGAITGKVGDRLKFFEREYRIAAKMDNTGTGFDASVFMNMDAARRAADDFVAMGGSLTIPADAVSSLIVMVDKDYTADGVSRRMNEDFDYGNSGIVVVSAKKIVNNVSGNLRVLVTFVALLAALLWVLSVAVLAIVFSVMLNERKREFGILRALGITRKRLVKLVFLESGIVSLVGSVAGVFLAALLILPFRSYIHEAVRMPYMQPSIGQFILLVAASLLLSFAVGPLASLLSSRRIRRGDAYAVIREGEL
ncbi:MAG: ABC transporter permease [Clostridiales Family XIII bacterium]|jgi:putative ABC transport system permease protein|nr:ABC transporter permease [Clostridiales Family XIII bacterium]